MPIPGAEALAARYVDWGLAVGIFLGVLALVYVVGRLLLVPPLERLVRLRNPNNTTIVAATVAYARIVVLVIAVLIAVTAAGYGNVIAGSAVVFAAVTLAIGVAGQEVIGNFVSGIFLVADPEFQVGDYIEWADEAGTVMSIGYRVTRVRTPAGVHVTVPNTTFATTTIHSPFTRGRYQMAVEIGVRIADHEAAEPVLERAATQDPRVLDAPEPRAYLERFTGNVAILAVQFWVHEPHDVDLQDVRTAFGRNAARELDAAGIEVPQHWRRPDR